MKRRQIVIAATVGGLLAYSGMAATSEVTLPNNFTAGSPAVADQVNANFGAAKDAINNNHSRLTSLEAFAASPDISGNLTLAPSTSASVGNIFKGTAPFLHDYGFGNTFLGEFAGNFTMTGGSNTASGTAALGSNTSGGSNTADGYWALLSNADGDINTAIGAYAMTSNTHGSYNTANGAGALGNNTVGNYNTAIGRRAHYTNTSGSENTSIGHSALYNGIGNNNIAIGNKAGYNLTTGSNNIAIGNQGIGSESGTIRIGNNFEHTRAFIAGIRSQTTGVVDAIPVLVDSLGQLGTVSSSRRVKDHISDMGDASQVLMQLRPVTFYYKTDHNSKGRNLQYGLIAEEVAEVAPQLVARSKTGEIETVYYQHLTPMLLNEYQRQQRTIAAQAAMLQQQTATLASQAAQLTRLEQARSTQAARLTVLEQQVMQVTTVQTQSQRLKSLAEFSRR